MGLILGVLALSLALLAGSVRAQAPAPAPPGAAPPALESSKSYVYQYCLVILCMALGVFLVCQPSKREESIESRLDLAYGD